MYLFVFTGSNLRRSPITPTSSDLKPIARDIMSYNADINLEDSIAIFSDNQTRLRANFFKKICEVAVRKKKKNYTIITSITTSELCGKLLVA